jgi:hypothetical protein
MQALSTLSVMAGLDPAIMTGRPAGLKMQPECRPGPRRDATRNDARVEPGHDGEG